MEDQNPTGLSAEDLAAEEATSLPDKEVVSILDLNADLDLAIDAAAPIDLAVAANANVAAPIDAAVGANVLSVGSDAQALADQGVMITQNVQADAVAEATQDSTIQQGDAAAPAAAEESLQAPTATTDSGTLPDGTVPDGTLPDGTLPDGTLPDGSLPDTSSMLDGDLLNVNVDLAADADLSAPINGAVAANANVAAPIDAAVAANVGSVDSSATAVAQQDAIINQNIEGSAEATSTQTSDISQPDQPDQPDAP